MPFFARKKPFFALKKSRSARVMFPAKAILFGEYAVVLGQKALAAPVRRFAGSWKNAPAAEAEKRQMRLGELARSEAARSVGIDQKRLEKALADGLFFESNIPTGYGLGSSGAVTAAVFRDFSSEKMPAELAELQKKLAALESFFHGQSSGLDPLVSFLAQPVLIEKGRIEPLENIHFQTPNFQLFLLDTRRPRQAKPIIEWFFEKTKNDAAFKKRLENDLFSANSAAIEAFLAADGDGLFEAFSKISAFQLRFFEPMLPSGPIADLVAASFGADFFRLKICGAGGGGFLLGLARDFEKTRSALEGWPIFELDF